MSSVKNYIKELNDTFRFTAIVPLTIVLIAILCFLDNVNGLSLCLSLIPEAYRPFVFIGIAILLICWLFHIHFCSILKMPCINLFDPVAVVLLISDTGYLLIDIFIERSLSYRQCIGIPAAIFMIIFIVYHANRVLEKSVDVTKFQNIYDLYDIYNGDFDIYVNPNLLISKSKNNRGIIPQ